jgi:inner membrane protein
MDSLTHTVLGACIGEVLAGKKMGKKAMLWGALANNIPDIDVITSFWMSQADSLLAHRGFTHSILFALTFPLLLGYLFKRYNKNKNMLFRDWVILFGSGMFVHIFIDALTCYGTGWYEPFNHCRVTMNVLFVADPFYTISLLVSFVALLIIRSQKNIRKKIALWGIGISCLYVLYALSNKWTIDKHMKTELNRQNIVFSNYSSTPAPLNNFLWYLLAKNDSGFYVGYRSVFDKNDAIQFTYRPQNESLLNDFPVDADLLKLKRFAKGYYTLENIGDSIYFNDIRFGSAGGWADPSAEFVFRYCLNKNANNDLVIQRGRMKSAGKDALTSLWKRAMGE